MPISNEHTAASLAIRVAMMALPEKDRNGFLFAMAIADMMRAHWTKEMIRAEILKGLDVAWENRSLVID